MLVGFSIVLAPTVFADPSGVAQQELNRRAENTQEAQKALLAGDKAYRLADYEAAVAEYSRAHDLLPGGSQTSALKVAAAERLAQAAVERARGLAKAGDILKADSLLESVLAPNVAPDYAPAQQLREQLHDPIRYNPALTPEHVRNIDKVRRLLYEAKGFADLGQYDRSIAMYQAVLRVDPYNSAARRGMESVTRLRREYYDSARDEARANMLAETAAAWELRVPKPVIELANDLGALRDGPLLGGASAREKMESIVIPVVDMDQVGLREAIDFLREQSRTLDTFEPIPERKGIAFIVELGSADPQRARRIESQTFDLQLRNVPVFKVLDYITKFTGTKIRVDENAIVIRPAGAFGDDMVFRQFKVPPDFLSREAIQGAGDGGGDPFGDANPQRRGLVKRLTAQEYLKQKGVAFPEGSSATFSPSSSVLSVKTTQSNMALVEVIVDALVDAEPIMITVEARIIRSTQTRLEELGFDWLLGAQKVTNELFVGGGSVGNGTPLAASQLRPLTSGNRSGTQATERNSIDAVINRSAFDETFLRAPGSLTAFGLINNSLVATLMRGVNQNTGIDLVTKKSVVTRSGQTASIHSVREFIYPEEYEPPELPNSVGGGVLIDPLTGQLQGAQQNTFATPATPTSFVTTNLGCSMEVLPQLGEDGRIIEVSIKPEIREFDGFINYGTPITGGTSTGSLDPLGLLTAGNFGVITENAILMPVISTLRGNSTLSIADGETVVLGGLLNNSSIKVEDGVPILSKIPFFGRFFESQAETSSRSAYVILVSVRLQDPSGEPVNR